MRFGGARKGVHRANVPPGDTSADIQGISKSMAAMISSRSYGRSPTLVRRCFFGMPRQLWHDHGVLKGGPPEKL